MARLGRRQPNRPIVYRPRSTALWTGPSVRSLGTAQLSAASETSKVVPLPATPESWAAGDLCLIPAVSRASGGGFGATPSLWTPVVATFDALSSASSHMVCYGRILQAGDTNPTILFSSGRVATQSIAVKDHGLSVIGDLVVAFTTGAAAAQAGIDATAVTPPDATSLLLTMHGGGHPTAGSTYTVIEPASMAELLDICSAVAASTNAGLQVSSLNLLDGSSTGVRTATASANVNGMGVTVAIKAIGSQLRSGAATDNIVLGEAPSGLKIANGATSSSFAALDQPAGQRVLPGGATSSAADLGDLSVGAKAGSNSTRDAAELGDRAIGRKLSASPSSATVGVSGRPAGLKIGVATTADVVSLSGRAAGRKLSSAATADVADLGERPAGMKVASGSTSSTIGFNDKPSKGDLRSGATSSAMASGDRSGVGAKLTASASRVSCSLLDRAAGAKLSSGSTGSVAAISSRAVGRKVGIATCSDYMLLMARQPGLKLGSGAGADQAFVSQALAGMKRGIGATRSTMELSDTAIRSIQAPRDVTITAGTLLAGLAPGSVRTRSSTLRGDVVRLPEGELT